MRVHSPRQLYDRTWDDREAGSPSSPALNASRLRVPTEEATRLVNLPTIQPAAAELTQANQPPLNRAMCPEYREPRIEYRPFIHQGLPASNLPGSIVYSSHSISAATPPAVAQQQFVPMRRGAIACEECRRRKKRCSGYSGASDGKCTRCVKLQIECKFHLGSDPSIAFVPVSAVPGGVPPGTPLRGPFGQPLRSPYASAPQGRPSSPYNPPVQSPAGSSDNAQIGDPWQPPGLLTPSRHEESLWSAHLLQERVAPRDTLVDGSSTGYSTYRGSSATMMTPGYRHATANHGQPTSAGTAFNLQAQTASSSTPQVSQQAGFHGYSAGSMPTTTTQTAPDTMKKYADSVGLGVAYAEYQSTLQGIFRNVQDGVLETASHSLIEVSEWLLSHVMELGLTSDDQNLHDERIKLWEDFNHAWLAICQRQIEMMESGQRLQSGQILVPKVTLKKMGSELTRLCGSIEPQGLVDYQYGVWEEWIIAILEECLDLYASAGETGVVAVVDSGRGRGHDAAEWGQRM